MKKLIPISIITICGLTYTMASTLQEDLIEVVELGEYIRCYSEIVTENQIEDSLYEDISSFYQIVDARKMSDIAAQYMEEHCKEFGFETLEDTSLEHLEMLVYSCKRGMNDASLSEKDYTALLKACECITELVNKHPEVFTKIKKEL